MPLIRPGIRRLFRLRLFRPRTIAQEVNEEVALHLELRAQQFRDSGMSWDDAQREATRRFGTRIDSLETLHHAATRRERKMTIKDYTESLLHDVRYALRGLRRDVTFTVFVTATLALGIGVNAAMFGVVDRMLLRGPDHVLEPERVLRLYQTVKLPERDPITVQTFGYVMYDVMRKQGLSVAAYKFQREGATFGRGVEAKRWTTGDASADLFPMLGVKALHGRFFIEQEDSKTDPQNVVVIGYGAWQREFGADAAIVGKDIVLDDTPYKVVGVAPKGFTGPGLAPIDVWRPMSLVSRNQREWTTTWQSQWLEVIMRLKPGVTVERTNAALTSAFRQAYTGTEKADRESTLQALPISFGDAGKESAEAPVARWLVGVCIVVLLVACANVVNLLLARTVRRRREIAVRLALGISRARLTRMFLLEGLALALLGAAAGLGVAYATGALMRTTLLPDVDWTSSPVDVRVMMVSGAIALIVGFVVGMWPTFSFGRTNLTSSLKSGVRDGGHHFAASRSALTIAQAALSVVLLVGAALFVQSLNNVRAIDLGIQTERVLIASPRWPPIPRSTSDSLRQMENDRRKTIFPLAMAQLQQAAGVERASLSVGLPFNSSFSQSLRIPGWDSLPRLKGGSPQISAVTSDYFATTGMRLIRGRLFTDADRKGSEPVSIISQNMARLLWPGKDPIGTCLFSGDVKTAPCSRIVGIVNDAVRFRIRDVEGTHYYVPFGQESGMGGTKLLVRPRGDASTLMATVRKAMFDVDPSISFVDVKLMQTAVDPQVRPWKLGASMFTLMGVLALCVAAFGLYSVIAYLVAQRTHELGVRIALGASGGSVVRLVMQSGVGTTLIGCVLGVLIAMACGRFIEPLLYKTAPINFGVYGAVVASLLGVAVLASLLPALKARRVNPMEALRSE